VGYFTGAKVTSISNGIKQRAAASALNFLGYEVKIAKPYSSNADPGKRPPLGELNQAKLKKPRYESRPQLLDAISVRVRMRSG